MNDFTKEELKLLSQALNVAIFEGAVFYRPQYQEIKNKIKSMIDYYCEHNEKIASADENGHMLVMCGRCDLVLWHEKS